MYVDGYRKMGIASRNNKKAPCLESRVPGSRKPSDVKHVVLELQRQSDIFTRGTLVWIPLRTRRLIVEADYFAQ